MHDEQMLRVQHLLTASHEPRGSQRTVAAAEDAVGKGSGLDDLSKLKDWMGTKVTGKTFAVEDIP